ncbi:beta-defensin 135 [Rhinolophus sinicus]|uniref:beta-defensin 135 n=1 Tax=Rhinolophus sinicus TaxID=89399 RepID=UPI003D78B550
MRSLRLVLPLLVLFSYVPQGNMESSPCGIMNSEGKEGVRVYEIRSGPNRYIKSWFATCWHLKGVCKKTCAKNEEYHIFCNAASLCCIDKKYLPVQTGK